MAERRNAFGCRDAYVRASGWSLPLSPERLQASLLCSTSLTPPATRAPRLRPLRPGWTGNFAREAPVEPMGLLVSPRAERPRATVERFLPRGRRQEVVMFKTTNQTRVRAAKRVQHTQVPWPFGLHRKIAAAATIAAACVFSLQMRNRRSCLDPNGLKSDGTPIVLLDALRDAKRREGSP